MSIDASILEEFGAGYTPPVDEDRTCLSWWYPKIAGHVPTPLTQIVKTEIELWRLIDGGDE